MEAHPEVVAAATARGWSLFFHTPDLRGMSLTRPGAKLIVNWSEAGGLEWVGVKDFDASSMYVPLSGSDVDYDVMEVLLGILELEIPAQICSCGNWLHTYCPDCPD